MKKIHFITIVMILSTLFASSRTVYEDAENGNIAGWENVNAEGFIRNVYHPEIDSRAIYLGTGGIYDLWLENGEAWNNTTERILSWRMNFPSQFMVYISVETTDGHRWLFSNLHNGHYGYHGVGILNGYGTAQTHNGTWQTMVMDLDRILHDTEPNLDIVRVNRIRFQVWGDSYIDNIALDNPSRIVYEDGNSGVDNWLITDNDPAGATLANTVDDEEVILRGSDGSEFTWAYNDNVINMVGVNQDNAFTIGAINGENAWNNSTEPILQWKMRSSMLFRVIVHIDTLKGPMDLHYTPNGWDAGLSEDGLSIHHGLGISRNGDGRPHATSTDGRWITYTRDIRDDLRDYDTHNRLLSINGMTIRGTAMVDDIQLIDAPDENYIYPITAVYEDGEDETIEGWSVFSNSSGQATITNIFDATKGNRVISLQGAGTSDGYMLGARSGDGVWRNVSHDIIQWSMNYNEAFVVYVATQTSNGERLVVYTARDDNTGLNGTSIGVGIGADASDGTWRTFTRNVAEDIAQAEPGNQLVSINAFLIRGSGRIDDIRTRSSLNPDPDVTPPVLTLLGENEINVPVGANYFDSGVVAEDNIDGIITNLVQVTNTVNTSQLGDYTVTYNVQDSAGNSAIELTRNVHVVSDHRTPVMLENAEDGTVNGWSVRAGGSGQGRVNNVFDEELQSRVIEFEGSGTLDSYLLESDATWNSFNDRTITWRMRFDEPCIIYVRVQTLQGERTIYYTPSPNRGLLHNFPGGIHHGLGSTMQDGRWRRVTRDLQSDLKDAEPDNEIISVGDFIVRGSGRIDDLALYTPSVIVYENGESGIDGWRLFDDTPDGATIANIPDNDFQGNSRQGNVISLQGNGFDNAYIIGDEFGGNAWANETQKILRWRFREFGPEPIVLAANPDERGTIRDLQAFEFRVKVETEAGMRDLVYTLGAENLGMIENGTAIHHGLGDDRMIGSVWAGDDPMNLLGLWQTVTRDLEEDIRDFEPTNRLLRVNGFIVRNSGLVDDIEMLSKVEDPEVVPLLNIVSSEEQSVTQISANIEVILSDVGQLEIEYGETVDYGMTTTREESFDFSTHVQTLTGLTPNTTYHYRIHAWNRNGVETVSEDRVFTTLSIEAGGELYEDAEDGNIEGWSIYDNDPEGASITNVEDAERGSRVIELSGDRYANGYILGGRNEADGWNNQENTILRWSMNFSEGFVIYIPIETTNGRRYLVYDPRDEDRGISGEYIRLGLGDDVDDGTWRTITRNLEEDLQAFEPNNEIQSVNGFMVRGSGRIDDIRTLAIMPPTSNTLYEDAEDGNIEGWSIYDNDPEGASITNVEDAERGSRVIELSGDRYANGYILGGRNEADGWNNQENTILRWSMNFSEGFVIYIPIETTNGRRYLVYDPRDEDRGISGEYIRLGLGDDVDDGTWRTITRNLEEDLQAFEPNNEIQSVNGFMVRGSGRIDDIAAIHP